jgi:hypothetical protein
MARTDEEFSQAAQDWDLETLYADLASAKGKRLTPTEKLHLRGLLCGHSPVEIADKLQKNPRGVETDLCATLYRYVKSLVSKNSEKIDNWRKITEWLDDAGYKSLLCAQPPVKNNVPENSSVNITNIYYENNHIKIDVFLQITVPVPSTLCIQNLDLKDDDYNIN